MTWRQRALEHRPAIGLAGSGDTRGPFRSDRLRRNRIEAAGWRSLETAPEDIDALAREAGLLLRWAA